MYRDKSDFESYPPGMDMDETDVNLRTYFTRMDDAKVDSYDPDLSDEELMTWDGNFKNDGSLMITCSEREVQIDEYRSVLELYIEFRKQLARK
jgi:hypothetical protein